MSFSFGRNFKINIFGASHDNMVGVMIEGLKAGTFIDFERIKNDLKRRRPKLDKETKRVENDELMTVSGLQDGKTAEAPLLIAIKNNDIQRSDYDELREKFRPGHADYTKFVKYDDNAFKTGGGIFSGRMTAPIVVAGSIAASHINVDISSRILFAEDKTGSMIEVRAKGVRAGLGEPFFDSVESCLSHLLFSIPSVKGVLFGDIEETYKKRGDEVTDSYLLKDGKLVTEHNYDGGIQGGITDGDDIVVRVLLKPIASLNTEVNTVDKSFKPVKLKLEGRHDTQIAERVRVVLESCMAIVLFDLECER